VCSSDLDFLSLGKRGDALPDAHAWLAGTPEGDVDA